MDANATPDACTWENLEKYGLQKMVDTFGLQKCAQAFQSADIMKQMFRFRPIEEILQDFGFDILEEQFQLPEMKEMFGESLLQQVPITVSSVHFLLHAH
jgi:hypothetical protein